MKTSYVIQKKSPTTIWHDHIKFDTAEDLYTHAELIKKMWAGTGCQFSFRKMVIQPFNGMTFILSEEEICLKEKTLEGK